MIPKRIFYVWGAKEPKRRDVLACMQSWTQNCSEYEIIEINENCEQYFNFQQELENNKWFKTVYDNKMWAFVADYIRIIVLYKNGGIYLDTDVTVLKNFDDFLKDPAFVGMQSNKIEEKFDFTEPAILGAQKENNFLAYLADIYKNDIWKIPFFTMPDLFDFTIKNLYKNEVKSFGCRDKQNVIMYNDIHIYPERVFIPFRFTESFSQKCIKNQTHTIHWWGASWIKPKFLNFLQNKHKKNVEELLKNEGYWRTFYFLFIPILKIFVTDNQIKIANIPVIKIQKTSEGFSSKYTTIYELKLFDIIPFFKVKSKENGRYRKYYVFNILFSKAK